MKKWILLFICCTLPSVSVASEPITKNNWLDHPEVMKIRSLYSEINEAERSGKLTKKAKKCNLAEGSFEIEGSLFKDKNGVVRKYALIAGSGDSVGHAEYYYDEKGISRFTYRTRGAANGTKAVDRIYFNESGKPLYTDHKKRVQVGRAMALKTSL